VSTNKDSFSIGGPADVTVSADSPDGNYSHLFEGLTNGVNYYVAVRAVSAAGNSAVGGPAAAMPYGVPTVPVAPTVVAGDAQATVSMGATPASQGATIIRWVVSGGDTAGHTVTNKVAAYADGPTKGGFALSVALGGPNVWGTTWTFTAIPWVQSANKQIKEGGQSLESAAVQPKGALGKPTVQIVRQQGVKGGKASLLFSITPGNWNGNPPNPKTGFTYSSPWANGTANGDQFFFDIPITETGTVTVTQTADGGTPSSTGTVVVQPTISVDSATAVMTVRYVPESPLYCQVMTGTTASNKILATEANDGSSSYHTYTYSYALVPAETTITLQCGGDSNNPTTYQITTTTAR
jgi:hypothetical protein